MRTYYETISQMISTIAETQGAAVAEAGRLGAAAIRNGGLIHVFGTGHSHLLAEEPFYRAGGLLPVNAILEPALMLHDGVQKSSALERLPGLAERILALQPLAVGDLIIIVSNSGRNPVPVEAALYAKERGLAVVAITSLAHSRSQPPLHLSGKRLYELADVVIDNAGVPGDAALEVPGLPVRACATSTVTGAFIIQSVMAAVLEHLLEAGTEPPVMQSGNVEGCEAYNQRMIDLYAGRVQKIRSYLG